MSVFNGCSLTTVGLHLEAILGNVYGRVYMSYKLD